MISCEMDLGLDILLERIWEELRLVKYDSAIRFSLQQAYRSSRLLKGLYEEAWHATGLVRSDLLAPWRDYRNRLSQYSSRSGLSFQICTGVGQVKQIFSTTAKGTARVSKEIEEDR